MSEEALFNQRKYAFHHNFKIMYNPLDSEKSNINVYCFFFTWYN